MPLDMIAPKAKKSVKADFSVFNSQVRTMSEVAHKQWATRGPDERWETMEKLIGFKREQAEASKSRIIRLADIEPVLQGDDIGFHIGNGEVLAPTHHSMSQLCHADNLGAPLGLLRDWFQDDPETVVKVMNKARMKLSDPDKQVGLYSSGTDMRAITGPNYGRIMDLEVATELWRACQESGFHWQVPTAFARPGTTFSCVDPTKEETTIYGSAFDMWVMLVDQETPIQIGWVTDPKTGERVPDLYSRGIIVRNSECGGIGLWFTTFLYRWICCNRRIHDMLGWQQINLKHTKNVRLAFEQQLIPAANAFLRGDVTGIADAIQAVDSRPFVRSDAEALHVLTHDLKFAPEVAKSIMGRSLEEEGVPLRTVGSVVQAMTSYARDIPYTDVRVQAERAVADLVG